MKFMRLVLYDGIDLIRGVACFFIHSNTDVALSPGLRSFTFSFLNPSIVENTIVFPESLSFVMICCLKCALFKVGSEGSEEDGLDGSAVGSSCVLVLEQPCRIKAMTK